MKRVIALILILLTVPALAGAEPYIELQPGLYEVGYEGSVPGGNYDIRFHGLQDYVIITYSTALTDDGEPDLTERFSFQMMFSSPGGWWNPGGFLVLLLDRGYLKVEHSPIRLFPEP